MLKYVNYSIVFQEVPDEVTLAINISNCPNRCKGCHSPYLMEDMGEVLSRENLEMIIEQYKNAITCVCFMGGDSEPKAIEQLATCLRQSAKHLKIAWYSGKSNFADSCTLHNFDYIKLGAYVEELGGLDSTKTNQRFYKILNGRMIDITSHFMKEIQ
jgi:anaerobic ribonucleoside-triphosphate reductase activating protein